jgi:hypothetical protein
MGRKGVSKRKPPKSVNQKTLGKGEIDVVLSTNTKVMQGVPR